MCTLVRAYVSDNCVGGLRVLFFFVVKVDKTSNNETLMRR